MLEKGYGIMPNKILFDKELSSTSKLIFVYISSLCAQEGYCWATNEHIAVKFGISARVVSRSVKQLEKYIYIKNPYNEKRLIHIDKNVQAGRQKRRTSLDRNVQHNSIKNSTSIKGYKNIRELGLPDLSAGSDVYDRRTVLNT